MILFIKENTEYNEHFIKSSVERYIEINAVINKDNELSYRDFSIEKDTKGKPFLSGYNNINISISHSKNIFVVVLSDKKIGVDIEKIDEERDFLRLSKRYFSEAEIQKCNENGAQTFYDLWTKKEAFSKFIGSGITRKILEEDISEINLSTIDEKENKNLNATFTTINFIKEFVINICHEREDKLLILL